MTQEEALGYMIAVIEKELSYFDAADRAALVMELESLFQTMLPEEAARIYAEKWGRSS